LVTASAASHSVLYLGLTWSVKTTPVARAVAFVSRLARPMEPRATPRVVSHTRDVTWLWTRLSIT